MNWAVSEMASAAMRRVWSSRNRTEVERRIWLTVLEYHVEVGVATADALYAYRAVFDVDTSVRAVELEKVRRHDVKARIEAWNEVAGYEQIHLGMTSADIVDNAAQVQLRQAATLLLAEGAFPLLPAALDRQRVRGIWGAIGTGVDQCELTGRPDAPWELSARLASAFGFGGHMESVGQQYPRSADLDIAHAIADGISHMTVDARGRGLEAIAAGFGAMLLGVSGDQWAEGDVSSSVVRRVALPGICFAGSAACRL